MTIRVYRYFDSVVVTPDGATVESYLSPMQAEELAAQLLRYAEDVRQSPSLDGIRGAADIGADSKPAPRYERDSKGEIIEQGKVATARPAGGGPLWTVWKFPEGYKARAGAWRPHDGSGSVPTLEEALSMWNLRKED